MTHTIKAENVKPGMILSIYGGTKRVDVEQVTVKWGAVMVREIQTGWSGLSVDETVTVLGYFNPECYG